MEKIIDRMQFGLVSIGLLLAYPTLNVGGVAQLGARLHGMQKVRGSSPLASIRLTGCESNILIERSGGACFIPKRCFGLTWFR